MGDCQDRDQILSNLKDDPMRKFLQPTTPNVAIHRIRFFQRETLWIVFDRLKSGRETFSKIIAKA